MSGKQTTHTIIPSLKWIPKGKASTHLFTALLGDDENPQRRRPVDDAADAGDEEEEETYRHDEEDEDWVTNSTASFEDTVLKDSDFLLVAAKHEYGQGGEENLAEIYTYDSEFDTLFIRNSFVLPEMPLCVAWIGHSMPSQYNTADSSARQGSGNYAAFGTMVPAIEIFNLDIANAILPDAVLGGCKKRGDNNTVWPPEQRAKKLFPYSHTDAVLSLQWNPRQPHFLASGSADHSVKVWDLNSGECKATLQHHRQPVNNVRWDSEGQRLLTTSLDGTAAVAHSAHPKEWLRIELGGAPESAEWHPFNPALFYVTSNTGEVALFEARKHAQPLWKFQAHEKGCSGLSVHPTLDGLIATGGEDNEVALWDLRRPDEPQCLQRKNFGMGNVLSVEFNTDDPTLLAASGSKGKVLVWTVTDPVRGAGFDLAAPQAAEMATE